ncbi:MAG: family transporter [Steroidobacteraceae bacterium]|jgi:drug/metabolite transporter (DMT)-like permease|nr:family transporter [Steroidobacteraceae bacterium]
MNPHRRALLELHACVVLWGFTAILGKLITLSAVQLVWWRMLLVALALACFPRAWRALRGMSARDVAVFAGIGCVIALHWLCFYGSVKLANASVAATTMALAPVAVALSEPWLTGARFERHNLVLAILVIPGVALVVGGMPSDMHLGFWVGVASAVLAGVFNLLNKRHLGQQDAMAVTWIELGAGFLLLAVVMPFAAPAGGGFVLPSVQDSAWLLVLAVFCTLIPFVLALRSLRHLSAFTTQLAVNLEPVYAILLAVIFLGEARELGLFFFIGVLIVLAGVFGHGFLQRRSGRIH